MNHNREMTTNVYASISDPILQKVVHLATTNANLYNRITQVTTDMRIISRIIDNIPLFNLYMRAGCIRKTNLSEAFNYFTRDSVLIHFAELDLYGIFTLKLYQDFCYRVKDKIDDEEFSTTNIYQLVLSEQKQKFVFACTDPKHYEKIKNYAAGCFGPSASVTQTEITCNIYCNDEVEIMKAHNKLYNYILSKGDKECCEVIKNIPLITLGDHNYRTYCVNDSVYSKDLNDLVNFLKNVPTGLPLVINIDNSTDKIVNNGSHNTINISKISYNNAVNWIEKNPPQDYELTTAYYNRYLSENNTPIHINRFGKLVRDQGYKTRQGTGGVRYWVPVYPQQTN